MLNCLSNDLIESQHKLHSFAEEKNKILEEARLKLLGLLSLRPKTFGCQSELKTFKMK
jgi:hypothetical protein